MKCQTILQNELHEKYILAQLDDTEKEKYELHLKECKDCRAELEAQRVLIAGIRESGLAEMKSEIKRQVELSEINHPGMTWGRISKIAAVLLIFVLTPSVIIYLSKSSPELVPVAQQKTETAPADLPYSTADAAMERRPDAEETELMPEANVEALKIPRQTDASGNRQFKKNDSPKVDLDLAESKIQKVKEIAEIDMQEVALRAEPSQPQIALNEEASTFKDEKEEGVLESKVATPEESQPIHPIEPISVDAIEKPKIKAYAFSSSEYSATRTYVYEAPETGQKKISQPTGRLISKSEKARKQRTSDLRFISNGHAVLVHLKTAADEVGREVLAETADVPLPKSFSVEIIEQDSLDIEMNWLAAAEFLKIKPEEIKLEISSEQIMQVIVTEKIYHIDLNKTSTEAILIN